MPRKFINQLTEGENIDQAFLVAEKQLRTNRAGNLYLQMRLADKSGMLTAMLWNANDKVNSSFEGGDYVNVQGTTQFYNGAMQVIVSRVHKVDVSQVDEQDFVTLNTANLEKLSRRLSELLRGIRDYHLRNLAECFLVDEAFMSRFSRAPAGIKHHHAYHGGLLEHVVNLMEVVAAVSPFYPDVNADLLLMGAFLHDAGKIEELTYDREFSYSDVGQLLGHLVIGVGMVDEKVREAEKLSGEPFPEELALRLKHMILSHHGQYDHGSPKLPMTLEALMLHYLDSLDAKIHNALQLMREDATGDANWTAYQPNIQRKLYKSGLQETAE